jgi:hypothetical protein
MIATVINYTLELFVSMVEQFQLHQVQVGVDPDVALIMIVQQIHLCVMYRIKDAYNVVALFPMLQLALIGGGHVQRTSHLDQHVSSHAVWDILRF